MCSSLTSPSSGHVTVTTDNTTTTAVYQCASGYQIVGEDTLICTITGQWSQDEPRCG